MLHPGFTDKWAVIFLSRSQAIAREAFVAIYGDIRLRASYRVCLAFVKNKHAPPAMSLNLVKLLRWGDLLKVLRQPYLAGALKQRIVNHLLLAFPQLTLGEKVTIAKQAPRELVSHLRTCPEDRVIRALMLNYFFTHQDALFLVHYPRITAPVLEALALSDRWARHKDIRRALLRNPKTPAAVILPLAAKLTEYDLRQLLKDPRMALFTRNIIHRILGARFLEKKGGSTSKTRGKPPGRF